jgi:hypothetical protein
MFWYLAAGVIAVCGGVAIYRKRNAPKALYNDPKAGVIDLGKLVYGPTPGTRMPGAYQPQAFAAQAGAQMAPARPCIDRSYQFPSPYDTQSGSI